MTLNVPWRIVPQTISISKTQIENIFFFIMDCSMLKIGKKSYLLFQKCNNLNYIISYVSTEFGDESSELERNVGKLLLIHAIPLL